MTNKQIEIRYNLLLHAFGLPYRLQNGRSFQFQKAVKTFQIGEEKVVHPTKQQSFFNICCKDSPGWLLYICSDQFLYRPKHIAANVMQSYFERDLRVRWLTTFDKLDKLRFNELNLVVIDALFHDTSNYKRDRIYECLNYNCNKENLSVIVIGKNSNPMEMGNQLGTRPDFAIMCK